MSMSPWKGWAANGRPSRADGESSPRRERSGGATESQHPGLTQAPGYGRPVAWEGWSALRQESAVVTPTTRVGWVSGQEIAAGWRTIRQEPAAVASAAWTGWTRGQEPAGVPAQPTPSDEHLSDPTKPAFLAGVTALKHLFPPTLSRFVRQRLRWVREVL